MVELQKQRYLQFPFLIIYLAGTVFLCVVMFIFSYQPLWSPKLFDNHPTVRNAGADYNYFYFAGKRAWEGKNFYFPINDRYDNETAAGLRFAHSPLVAYFFVPFSFFSFSVSLLIYSLFAVLLLLLSVFILSKLVLQKWWYFAITSLLFLFSLFFLLHLDRGQKEVFVLCLMTLCLLFFLKQKYKISGLMLAGAAMFNLIPIIFIPYFFIKNRKVFYSTVVFLVVFFVLFGFNTMTDFVANLTSIVSTFGITAGGMSNGLGGMFYNRFTYNWLSCSNAQIILAALILIISATFYYLSYKMNKAAKQSDIDNRLVLLEFGTLMFFLPLFQSNSPLYTGIYYLFIFTAYWNFRPILSTAHNVLIQALFYLSFSQGLLFPFFNERPFVTIFAGRPAYMLLIVVLLWYCYYKNIYQKQQILTSPNLYGQKEN